MRSTPDAAAVAPAAPRRVRIVLDGGNGRSVIGQVARLGDDDMRLASRAAVADHASVFNPANYPHENVSCNLCGQDDAEVVAERDRYQLPTRIVQCRGCGLRYINPRMTRAAYGEFYRIGYRPLIAQLTRRPVTAATLEPEQWQYALELSELVGRWIEGAGHVLDVGGSTGVVGRFFRARFGCEVTVIDPCLEELTRATGCRQIHASAEDVSPFPSARVALLCRTVDHLLDPKGVLTRLAATTRCLVIDAMNIDGWSERARYKVDHPYAFTARSLRQMVEAAGWRIVADWRRREQQYVGLVCSSEE